MSKLFSIVIAATQKGGIGHKNGLPWPSLRSDMKHFNLTTTGTKINKRNAVLMGRVTFDSLPDQFKPLSGRINVVVSRKMSPGWQMNDAFFVVPSFEAGLAALECEGALAELVQDVYVIGGAEIYRTAIKHPRCNKVLLTRIFNEFPCDRFFSFETLAPGVFSLDTIGEVIVENGVAFQMQTWQRGPNPEEQSYLNLVREVMETGNQVVDRTLVGTKFLFGRELRFRLQDGKRRIVPLYTTKSVFWRGIVVELLWFLSGSTDATVLSRQGVKIWDGNSSREFNDKLGFKDRRVGDLGPVYGFQWRFSGAKYIDTDTCYKGQGIDQIASLIDKIRNNPSDRRMIVNAYNVSDLHLMALPPCHYSMEFCVDEVRRELSCKVNMRSNDLGLGNSFNVAQMSLLVHLLSSITGYNAGELILSIGNAHVYLNHQDQLLEQLKRTPSEFPTIEIDPKIKEIDDFRAEHIKLIGYNPQSVLKMQMAI